jgi:hypothetical protein
MLIKLNVTINGNVYVNMNGPTGTYEPSHAPRPCPSGPTGSTGPSGPSVPSGPTGLNGPSIDLTQ